MGGFSFASVILSYFMVAGGLLTGSLLMAYTHQTSEPIRLVMWAVGAFIGGFFAARASRGSTILEPAIGAILLVVTIALMIGGSETGKMMWGSGQLTSAGKIAGEVAGALAVGALAGAFLSEKLLGEATVSAVPWLLYASLTSFGAAFVATFVAAILFLKGDSAGVDSLAKMMIVGIGIGGLVGGLAIGASARVRVLGAAFIGGVVGTAGFFAMFAVQGTTGRNSDAVAGIAVFAGIGAVLSLIGAAIGWAAVGKRAA